MTSTVRLAIQPRFVARTNSTLTIPVHGGETVSVEVAPVFWATSVVGRRAPGLATSAGEPQLGE